MINWINIAKGFGIIFIVFGHSHAPDYFYHFFYYFHIPLFFFISGYLFNKEQPSLDKYIKNKFFSYMIPYFVYGLFFTFMMIILLYIRDQLLINKFLLIFQGYLFGQIDFMANKNLWFLPSLFLTSIIGYFLITYMNLKSSIKNNIFMILILLSSIYLANGMENYIMSITTVPSALLFFYIGFHYKSFEYLDTLNNLTLLSLLLCITIIVYFISYNNLNQIVDIGNNRIRFSIILMIINAVLGIYFIIKLSKYIKKNYILEYIGKSSLYIFMFHQAFVPIINYIYKIWSINEIWYITGLIKLMLSILIYTTIIKYINSTKYKDFF